MPESFTRTYAQSATRVFDAALRAVQSAGHRLDNVDEETGLLTFTTDTGVLEGLVSKDDGQVIRFIRDDGNGLSRIDVSGQPRNRWQLGSEGSRAELAELLFDQIDASLAGVV